MAKSFFFFHDYTSEKVVTVIEAERDAATESFTFKWWRGLERITNGQLVKWLYVHNSTEDR